MTKHRSPKDFQVADTGRLEAPPQRRFSTGDQSRTETYGFLDRVPEADREKRQARRPEHAIHLAAGLSQKARLRDGGREAVSRKVRRAPTQGRDCLPHGGGCRASGQATGDAPPRRAYRRRVAVAATVYPRCPSSEKPKARAAAELCHPRSPSRCGGLARQDRSRAVC